MRLMIAKELPTNHKELLGVYASVPNAQTAISAGPPEHLFGIHVAQLSSTTYHQRLFNDSVGYRRWNTDSKTQTVQSQRLVKRGDAKHSMRRSD